MLLAMMIWGRTFDARFRQGDGAGGGAASGAAAAEGGAGAAGAGASAAAQAGGGAAGAGAAGGQGTGGNAAAGTGTGGTGEGTGGVGDQKPWYETRAWADPTLQQQLIKAGYHKGTEGEALEKALKGEATATARLGRNPAQLLDAPAEGQAFTDWLKANGGKFGVPDAADKYDIKLPENMPKGMPMDDALLTAYKSHALERGLPPALVQDAVSFFAENMGSRFSKMATDAAVAEGNLTTALQEAWGGEYKQNQQLAIRTFQALAASQKLSPEQSQLIATKLNEGLGDATLLKFFHGLSGLIGEDTLAIPKGGSAPALALAEAQQRKAAIMERHTGDMAKARGDARRTAELQKELQGLNAIIVQYGG